MKELLGRRDHTCRGLFCLTLSGTTSVWVTPASGPALASKGWTALESHAGLPSSPITSFGRSLETIVTDVPSESGTVVLAHREIGLHTLPSAEYEWPIDHRPSGLLHGLAGTFPSGLKRGYPLHAVPLSNIR